MPAKIYLSPPHLSGFEIKYVEEAFASNWITPLGPCVEAFEEGVCHCVGLRHGLALTSGTASIHLALRYLSIERGDHVFCSSLTFAGSCNPILYQHATPVFIDAEPQSWNMSPVALEKAFHWAKQEYRMPKAVIIVDLYGQSANYDELLALCEHYGVPVIEDAAEALGATYKDRPCGSFGRMGVFSFNGNKIITTSGGGMVVSNEENAILKMRYWATQAREPELQYYEHVDYGYNYRLSNICAAIGLGQLQVLDARVRARKRIFERYKEAFASSALDIMPIVPSGEPNYWMTALTVDRSSCISPKRIINYLHERNIEARHLWKPMNLQPVFREAPFFAHAEDVGADLFARGLCLPSGSSLSSDEQDRVIEATLSALL